MSPMKKKLKFDTEQPAIDDLKLLSVKISKRTSEAATELLGTGTIVCDGVDFYVITAAHCFRDENGQQNCLKDDVVLTLYNDQYKPTNLDVKRLELSDTDKDTAIISIKTPPEGYGYYLETLKLLGKELDGDGYVFAYTGKSPEGRLFTYKRVNTNVWANQDNIKEKGEDFYKTVKGSSGGGMLVRARDQIYCMGFIRSTFDKESTLAEVKVQPLNLFKTKWGNAFFSTIEDAIGESQFENSGNKLQQECAIVWRKIYDAISRQEDLDELLVDVKAIRKQYSIPKNTKPQNDVMSLLLRLQEPWTEKYQDIFLMAMEDQGLWLSIYGDNIPAITNGISNRPLAKKLEERAITLTKNPCFGGQMIGINDDQTYYEQMLRFAYALDFTNMKKMVMRWDAKGFWVARKALFANLFDKNTEALTALNEYLKDIEDNVQNEKFIATVVYNVVNGDYTDRKSYELFLNNGLEGISSILAYIADHIEKHQDKITVYGIHQRYIIGGEDTESIPEAMRLLRSIIDAGILPNFKFTYFVSQTNWLKVVKQLFTLMPYPILFYTLMYTDEKLLKRVGQEYAYTDDKDVIMVLPDIQLRMLNAIGNMDTPKIYQGLYLISAELYVALSEDIWYDRYKDNVLSFFCQEQIVKNVYFNDPIYVNVRKGMQQVQNTLRRIEIFKMLTSALQYNSNIINILIHDCFFVDENLMKNGEFLALLMNVIKNNPINHTYMIVSKFGGQKETAEKLWDIIDEILVRDELDFGSNTCNAICMLSGVVRDESIRTKMKELLLKKDIWNSGITDTHYTNPQPIGLEKVDASIGWTVADWVIIKTNMLTNLALIKGVRNKHKDIYQHFGRQYITLLFQMSYFIKNIQNVEGCEVQDVKDQIEEMLQELRGFKNVTAELSSSDYDTVADGIWYLRDRFVNEGLECCKMEIQLLIHRIQMQVPTALEYCVCLLSDMVEHNTKEMTDCFGDSLLEVVKKYAEEFEYETLFVNKASMFKWMKRIAKGIAPVFGEEIAVKYWLEDEKVNRFNFIGS